MIPTLVVISIISFAIIQLPPGDYLTSYMAQLAATGESIDQETADALRRLYGLDQPIYVQYLKWAWGVLNGNFGYSFEWRQPVSSLLGERLGMTLVVALSSLLFAWALALPIGIYSAVRQYSPFDYIATFAGFLGLAVPNFLIALIFLYISARYFQGSVGGLMSPQFETEPWSWAKLLDLLQHLWIPMVIIGTAGTAELIRITRANLLDELRKPYVETARAKGLSKTRAVLKYPVRVALNPFFSTIGYTFPLMLSGEAITAVVLSLPTMGPLLLRALKSQDMYLAGTFVMILAALTVVGTLLSDILLAMLDPRIRYD